MPGTITFDDSAQPIVIIRVQGSVDDECFDRYLAEMTRRLGHPFVYLYDFRDGGPISNGQRKRQAAWMKEHREMISRAGAATVFIIENVAVRFALSSVLLMQPVVNPYSVVGNFDDAVQWAQAHLAERGLQRPRVDVLDPRPQARA